MQRAATLATALSLITLAAAPARAELGASGTRLTVAGGAPRFYMTYGHLDERELFAPILVELKRLDVTFEMEGDACKVFHKGVKVATWPVVRSRDDIPTSPNQPFILTLGSTTFLPVKRLAKLLPIDLNWDRRSNTVAVAAASARPPVAATRPKPAVVTARPKPNVLAMRPRRPLEATRAKPAPAGSGTTVPPMPSTSPAPTSPLTPAPESLPLDPAATGAIELTGVTVEQVGAGLRLRVQSSAPVRPAALYLKAPARIAIDFPDARWSHGLQAPAGKGGVRSLRLGHPAPGQARLVLEVTSSALKLAGVEVSGGEVRLALGTGAELAKGTSRPPASALAAKVRAAVARRAQPALVRLTQSRGVIRVTPDLSQLPQGAEGGSPGSNAWQYIVIHHSATPSGNATSFDAVHRRKAWDGLAYHFVINNGKGNPDGHLEVSQRWSAQKHGARGRPQRLQRVRDRYLPGGQLPA